jgi:hypothetical protein
MGYDKINKILKESGITKTSPFETSNFFIRQINATGVKLDNYWENELVHSNPTKRTSITEFSRIEKKRIERTTKWYFDFRSTKTGIGDFPGEVEYFIIPIAHEKIPTYLSSEINSLGSFYPVYLSSIQASLQCPVLALFPFESKVPENYRLIKITNARKSTIEDKNSVLQPILIVEDFDELNYEKIYLDTCNADSVLEKQYVEKIIGEYFPSVKSELQSPILSSPLKGFLSGGVSMIYENKSYASNILDITEKISPPQYRIDFPKKFYSDKFMGIPFNVGDCPYDIDKKIETKDTNNLAGIKNLLNKKNSFAEFSVVGQYREAGRDMDSLNNLLEIFFKTDINISEEVACELRDDITTNRFFRGLNQEDIHINITKARSLQPFISLQNQTYLKEKQRSIFSHVHSELKSFFSSEQTRDNFANKFIRDCGLKLESIAASIARSNFRGEISRSDLDKAKGIITDSINQIFNSPKMEVFKRQNIVDRTSYKKRIVLDTISKDSLTFLDIWELLKNDGRIKSKVELQSILNELVSSIEVFYDKGTGKYKAMSF